ncbi:MAG: ribonuclease R [Verrucomicrobiales bacterium]|nr:ribonuclease R [Verrucomicrobiales bacterium]
MKNKSAGKRSRHTHRKDRSKSDTNAPRRRPSDRSAPSILEQDVQTLLSSKSYRPATVAVLLKLLKLPPTQQPRLEATLGALEKRGAIIRSKGGRFLPAAEADLIPGVIQLTRQGRGFLQPDEPGLEEIAIPEAATGTSLPGDRVLVRRDRRPQGLAKSQPVLTGSVVRILQRKRVRFVGTLQRGKRFLFVVPDDPRMTQNVMVPEPRDVGRPAQNGDKVVVELLGWENRHTSPEGEVVEVLGAPDAEGVDMLSVLRHYDLPLSFPREVLDEAHALAAKYRGDKAAAEDLSQREDCRSHPVITIDPDDAKDFDDAICVQRLDDGRWKVWVHIADVSHYVREGTALDREARHRGNSTYLVDRVIPMLPEALSNELCSLKPQVDRLTKCAEFQLSREGHVEKARFYSAVIHSQHRYTYQEALAILQARPNGPLEEMLHDAHEIAQKLRRHRFKKGALDLDFPEKKIRLDEHGRVRRIETMENDISHQLIEEFMLLANEAVATHLIRKNWQAIHRIHEPPKDTKLNDYRELVLSHHVPCGNLSKREEVQKLLRRLASLPIGQALKIGFLRSLMRARYAMEPIGHYGLAKEKYTHFTSPIRRYADLVVHRVVFDGTRYSGTDLKQIADHLSDTERTSSDAERDSRDVKLYAYLEAQIAQEDRQIYEALVTDVRNFGFFVDVTSLGMSGLVHLSSVQDDFMDFDPVRGQLIGRQSHRRIQLGDTVRVQVQKVDRFKKQVDFRLAESGSSRASSSPKRAPQKSPPKKRARPKRPDRTRKPF